MRRYHGCMASLLVSASVCYVLFASNTSWRQLSSSSSSSATTTTTTTTATRTTNKTWSTATTTTVGGGGATSATSGRDIYGNLKNTPPPPSRGFLNQVTTLVSQEQNHEKTSRLRDVDPNTEQEEDAIVVVSADAATTTNDDNTLVLPRPGSCSCWNEAYTCNSNPRNMTCWKETRVCCKRTWHVSHKMGYILSGNLIKTALTGVKMGLYPPQANGAQFFGPEARFKHREVIVTRNFVDALVSGYLYHKTGHECTMDPHGKIHPNNTTGYLHKVPWDKVLARQSYRRGITWNRTVPSPPVRGRDICQYLAETSEEDGMRAFADFAVGFWYVGYYNYWEKLQSEYNRANNAAIRQQPSTMFVCYEELADPCTKRSTYHKMMEWLHPTGYNGRADPPPPAQQEQQEYTGKHATDHDPELRRRLGEIVLRLDRDVFDRWITRANDAFKCKSSIQYNTNGDQ